MPQHSSRKRSRAIRVLQVILAALSLYSVPIVQRDLQAMAVLDQVAGKPVPALANDTTFAVHTEDMTLPLPSGDIRARLYTPVGRPDAPALIVLHGVHHLGMDEPRMIAFARAMASTGLRVLTPELPNIDDYHVDAHTITVIGDTAVWFEANTATPNGKTHPVGILGLSFSGGLSLMAAAEPQYAPHIKFVAAIGSQDSMARVAAYYRTGNDPRPDGSIEHLAPHEYGPLVIEYQHLADFVPAADLPALRSVLRAHLYEQPSAERAAMATLTAAQAAEAKQLMDTSSPTTQAMMQASEQHHLDYAATVSPHGCLRYLTVPVYLLHGEADNIIPSAETLWLATEVPPRELKAMLISRAISHLDMDNKDPGLVDNLRLLHFFAQLLGAAQS